MPARSFLYLRFTSARALTRRSTSCLRSPNGQIGQNISNITELNLDIILIPQNVIDFDPRKSNLQGMYRELGSVKGKDTVAVYQVLGKGIITADIVDLLSGIFRKIDHLLKLPASSKSQISPGDIKA